MRQGLVKQQIRTFLSTDGGKQDGQDAEKSNIFMLIEEDMLQDTRR